MSGTGTAVATRGAPVGDWRTAARRLGQTAGTTPGRLQLMLVGLLVAAVLAGLLSALAVAGARSGTARVTATTEPLLVSAAAVYTSLADADATAAQAFLRGGLPPPAQTARYRADLDRAGAELGRAAALAGGTGPAADAVRTLATGLPVYAGLVEAARANNRQGFPVGAAYLAQASALCRDRLLPAAQQLVTLAEQDLGEGYRAARAGGSVGAARTLAFLLLVALVLVQLALFRRTHRVLNPALAAATVLAVTLVSVLAAVFAVQHGRLSRAQAEGSDPIAVLAQARIAALRMWGDEALTLVGRGNGALYEKDFKAVQVTLLGPAGTGGGLLGTAAGQASGAEQRDRLGTARAAAVAFETSHRRVRALDDGGTYAEAVELATSRAADAPPAVFGTLDGALAAAVTADQARFDELAGQARGGLGAVGWLAPLLAAAIAVLSVLGLRARLREYR